MKRIEICAVDHYDPNTPRNSAPSVIGTGYLVNENGKGIFYQNEITFQEVVDFVERGKKLINRPTSLYSVSDKDDGSTIIHRVFRSLHPRELESFGFPQEEIESARKWGKSSSVN